MKHYSPSFLCHLSLCARCTQDDEVTNEAAEAGTLFHDDIYKVIVENKPSGYEAAVAALERSDDHKSMVREAISQASGLLSLGLDVVPNAKFRFADKLQHIPEGVYPECELELWPGDRRHKVGRVDLLVVPRPGYGIIVDWKTNTNDSDFSWQIDSYAGALKRLCLEPWQQITGKIVAPNLDVHEDLVYDAAAVAAAEKRILMVEERANDPFTPPCPGEVQCKYCRCKRLGQCPALVKTVADRLPAVSEIPKDAIVEKSTDLSEYAKVVAAAMAVGRIIMKPKDLVERSIRRDWAACAGMLIEYVKDDDKTYFQSEEHSGEELPGYKVSTRQGNRVLDKSKLGEYNARLMQDLGMSQAEMLACCEPDSDLIVELAALKLGTKKAAMDVISAAKDLYSVRGAPITTVRRDASRNLLKLTLKNKETEKQKKQGTEKQ